MRIVFQGDSITDAFRKPDELNPAFQLGNGYAFLVAAKLGALYPERFHFINRGISGQTVQDLEKRWMTDAVNLQPDLISLLVGVNTVIRRQKGLDKFSNRELFDCYRRLLQSARQSNPNVCFVLMEPFLLEVGEVTAAWKSEIIPIQAEVARIADEFGAPIIPLQRIFDDALHRAPAVYWAYDGIHATHAGFQLMADAWLCAGKAHQLFTMPG